MRELKPPAFLDISLLGTVDHDVADLGVGEKFLQRTESEQLVDQHLFQRKLFPPVERELELCQHFHDDRAEFFGQLVLCQRCGGFGIDTLEQTGKDLLLDLVYGGFETFRFIARVGDRVGAVGQA